MPNFYLYNSNVCTRLYLFGQDLKDLLLQNSWQETDFKKADFIFVNSCSFLKKAENFFLSKIAELNRSKSSYQKIIVFGCLPHTSYDQLRQVFPGEIIATREISALAEKLNLVKTSEKIGYSVPRQLRKSDYLNHFLNKLFIHDPYLSFLSGEPAFYLNIARGCLGDCSYCLEKNARGSLSSHYISGIKIAFASGIKQGFKIFSLNGDDVGVFGWDRSENIALLIKELLSVTVDFKIILTEFNPWGLIKYENELKTLLASSKIAHITIPIQSGSNKILQMMKRGYLAETVIRIIKEIKNNNSKIVINTHFIVGFPGETEEDFIKTLFLVKSGVFDKVKIFKYSDRPQVPSYLLPDKVPGQEIERRYKILRRAVILHALYKLSLRNLLLNFPLYYK